MFCSKCGTQITEGDSFCSHCGTSVAGFKGKEPPCNNDAAPKGGSAPHGESKPDGSSNYEQAVNNFKDATWENAQKAANFIYEAAGGTGSVKIKLRDLFSDVFKHHSREEAEEIFMCGAPSTTPELKQVPAQWPRPWLYSRVFAVLLVTLIMLYISVSFGYELQTIGFIFVGALFVPISLVVFFFEVNAPRNICITSVFEYFFVGGVAALLMLIVLDGVFIGRGAGDLIPAMLTGVTEEIAKFVIVAFFLSRTHRRNYILNGLLIGACVGAGFAVFETAGYINNYGIEALITRAVLAIGGHTAWAAIEGAALAACEDESGFEWSHLYDKRFLVFAIGMIVLHGLWDTDLPLLDQFSIAGMFTLPSILLTIIVWVVLLVFIARGLAQINEMTNEIQS